jgi:hypothetical protein
VLWVAGRPVYRNCAWHSVNGEDEDLRNVRRTGKNAIPQQSFSSTNANFGLTMTTWAVPWFSPDVGGNYGAARSSLRH